MRSLLPAKMMCSASGFGTFPRAPKYNPICCDTEGATRPLRTMQSDDLAQAPINAYTEPPAREGVALPPKCSNTISDHNGSRFVVIFGKGGAAARLRDKTTFPTSLKLSPKTTIESKLWATPAVARQTVPTAENANFRRQLNLFIPQHRVVAHILSGFWVLFFPDYSVSERVWKSAYCEISGGPPFPFGWRCVRSS